MYKVFVNDVPIILSTKEDLGEKFTNIPLKTAKLKKIIRKISKGKLLYVNLYHSNEKKLLKFVFKKIKVVNAAGGFVKNPQGEILFIYRNKRWDLPKGKIEKFESMEHAAIRETEEETGVKDLEVRKFICKTYHIFKRKGKERLKVTYWYEMYTEFDGELVPELKEGIKKAKWKNLEKSRKALQKSYANIRDVFPKEYLAGQPKNRVA